LQSGDEERRVLRRVEEELVVSAIVDLALHRLDCENGELRLVQPGKFRCLQPPVSSGLERLLEASTSESIRYSAASSISSSVL
jgi:hypothetical protein